MRASTHSAEDSVESVIRERIAHHERKIDVLKRALAVITELGELKERPAKESRRTPVETAPLASNKDRVFAALGTGWATINKLAKETGLTRDQVRNVLYDPKVRSKFGRRQAQGNGHKVEYNWPIAEDERSRK